MKYIELLPDIHEECGVVGIYGHPEAANIAYLGLYALQHRGQEGINASKFKGICGMFISLPPK